MSIKKTLGRVGIVLSVAVTVAIGQTPASVKIGNQTWTKQNLNVKTADSWCYDNNPANCEKYGRLYTWGAAKKACASMGGKWRLPTNDDWDNLMMAVGGVRGVDIDGDAVYRNAGKKLKSKSGWNRCDSDGEECVKDGKDTDDYGFSALPSGRRIDDGDFFNVGYNGLWWSATENRARDAYNMDMYYDDGGVYVGILGKSNGFSVRCAKD